MRRREFIGGVASWGFASHWLLGQQQMANPKPALPAPVPWMTGLNPATPIPETQVEDLAAQSDLAFFSPAQMIVLAKLCDVLMPASEGRPGAVAADVPQFLDFLVSQSGDERRKLYAGGLDWLDDTAKQRYSAPFANLNPEQADTLLKPWLRTWMSPQPPAEPHADFINVAHAEIRTATFNSKQWSEVKSPRPEEQTARGLYWSPIEPIVRR